jgi:AcrR family transcriptional regulator
MGGLREKKKNEARSRILESAGFLFLKNGFDKTTTDAIADLAEVSVGTIYNHYGSKEEIFIDSLLSSSSYFKENTLSGLTERDNIDLPFLIQFINNFLQEFLQYGKPLLKELMRAGVNSSKDGKKLLSRLIASDIQMIGLLKKIISSIGGEENADLKGEMLFSIIAFEFIKFVYEEGYDQETLYETLEKKIRILFS